MERYNMVFSEVLEEMFNNKSTMKYWYQGEHFADGVYLDNKDGNLSTYCFSEQWIGAKNCGVTVINDGILNQKYRRVSTQPDVMRSIRVY